MNAVNSEADSPSPAQDFTAMRAAAAWVLGQVSLPRYQTVRLFAQDFTGHLAQLIPKVEQLVAERAEGDAQAMVALVAIGEARRRLGLVEQPGLGGEVERVKLLARSVIALRGHYDTLTGVRMCLVCDQVIEAGEESLRYEKVGPAGVGGRVHGRCVSGASGLRGQGGVVQAVCPG
ncbi:DUF6415 family natural product biosynthesis protein [Streptomyces sp. NPDC002143]